MDSIHISKFSRSRQYLSGIILVVLVSAISYMLSAYIGYRVVALILLFTVSVVAMFFDIFPVLLVALLSALIWDFFFIPPQFTFRVSRPEDALMLVMYFAIAMVNAALTYKNRQWEKNNRKKEEKRATLELYNTVLNSLSHELRTPISTIIGATDNLKTDKTRLSETDKYELIEEISKASIQLNRQVENLLNMSRLESGIIKPVKDWCDMNELIYQVRAQFQEHNSHSIRIVMPENLPLFKLDYGLIRQVLYNLIHNAILYTPAGSIITIRVANPVNKLLIVVEDNGKGFPEHEIENVFEKFYRLKNSATGGTGLGLSIGRGFVEAHKGSLKLENLPGGGAKFSILIPSEASGSIN